MRPSVPVILSFTAGYVDTAGFLALQGLFTAHVTGNFVMIGDALAHGSSGLVAKLLALPVFCVTILVLQVLALRIAAPSERALCAILLVEASFLLAGAVAAISCGDLSAVDSSAQMMTGMFLVIGMAIQNGAQKLYLSASPPTTMMTGTTTQVMLDLGAVLAGRAVDAPETVRPRLLRFLGAVVIFALGCAVAALAVTQVGPWAFAVPPVLVLAALVAQRLS